MTPPPPTSIDLIEKAVADETIDRATGYLYRSYAAWGDARLPAQYQGVQMEDDALDEAIRGDLASFSAAEQAALRPFLVRPSSPESYWSSDAVGRSATATEDGYVSLVSATACDAQWIRVDVPGMPITIWGRCRLDAAGHATVPLTDAVQQVKGFMLDLYPRMTALMGAPIGDAFENGTQGPSEPVEAGDGRIDIYVVEGPNVSYVRNVSNDALAVTRTAAPRDNGTTSAYMIVDPTLAASDAIFKSNVAHEFFHVLSDRYNGSNKFFCPYPDVTSTCSSRESHWFTEASATWAEFHFVPEARATEIYLGRYPYFVKTDLSLASGDINAYRSFVWPMFMEQEVGATAIQAAWQNFVGKRTWVDEQAAVDGQLPFAEHFGDFAVRVWNEKLLPGDPINPRWQALDPGFPTLQPFQGEDAPRYRTPEVRLDPYVQPTLSLQEDLPELWASYYDVSVDSGLKRLTINLAGLQPSGNLGVDALLKIRDGNWELRHLDPVVTELCLDRAADAIERMILVLSNHSQKPADHVKGTWEARGDTAGCATASDAIEFTYRREFGQPGDVTHSVVTESMSLHLRLTSAPGIPGGFDDAGSTIRANYDEASEYNDHLGGTCSGTGEAHGSRGGTFAPPEAQNGEGLTVSIYEDDPPETQTPRPGGWWRMSIAAEVLVDVTRSGTSPCGGGEPTTETQIIQLEDCPGTEIEDNDPARIFDFHCEFHGSEVEWTVKGKVTVSA